VRRSSLLLASTTLVACTAAPESELVTFTIPRGAAVSAVAETLAVRGLISDPGFFRFYSAVVGRARSIKAGTFELPLGIGTRAALHALVKGQPALRALVVREGLMLSEIAVVVERQTGIPADEFLVAARDSVWRALLGVPGTTLEGYLFPSTHMVRFDATAHEIVDQMVRAFQANWKDQWTVRADSLGLTLHEIVTLASIIEGEVRHDEDRRYVSSVYHNRLHRGMRLQADPTVIYALGRRRRLFERDYLLQSPYNTYQVDGLPPGPIGSPSAASIQAALYPAATDFLYFVARDDGRHVFSRTFAEHRRTIREIRNGG
jgi:UPF0755 protein